MLISFECHAKDVLVRGQIVVYDRKFRKYLLEICLTISVLAILNELRLSVSFERNVNM